MFENIDEITIQNANQVIKDLYKKLSDEHLTSIISPREILIRDFDNSFIFEDFFNELLVENKDVDNYKEWLIEELIMLIVCNNGEITIKEIYEILTTEEEVDRTKYKRIFILDDFKDVKIDSPLEFHYGDNVVNLNVVEETNYEDFNKKINHDLRREKLTKVFNNAPLNPKKKKLRFKKGSDF